jgi:hypothetical protein
MYIYIYIHTHTHTLTFTLMDANMLIFMLTYVNACVFEYIC